MTINTNPPSFPGAFSTLSCTQGHTCTPALPSISDTCPTSSLSYQTSGKPGFVTLSVAITQLSISLSPTIANPAASTTFSLYLVGDCGTTATPYLITVQVLANQPPTFSAAIPSAVTAYYNCPKVINLPTSSDPDGDSFSMTVLDNSLLTQPAFITFIGTSSITINYQSTSSSTMTIKVSLSDSISTPSSYLITLTLMPSSAPPAFTSTLSPISLPMESPSQSFNLPATANYIGETNSITATTFPSFFSVSTSGLVTLATPHLADVGSHAVTIRVSDSCFSTTATLTITVTNPPPVLAPLTD